jgi:hypothetical protein
MTWTRFSAPTGTADADTWLACNAWGAGAATRGRPGLILLNPPGRHSMAQWRSA